jgi:type II secretion system protein H
MRINVYRHGREGSIQQPSAIRPTQAPAPLGFTLIELLVVLVILGVVISLTGLTLTAGSASDTRHAELFERRLVRALDLAQASGRPVRVRYSERADGEFWQRAPDGRWQMIKALADESSPAELRVIRLTIDERNVPLTEWLRLTPEGSGPAVTIIFSVGGVTYRLNLDSAGQVQRQQPSNAS